jgi:hypothetical protein
LPGATKTMIILSYMMQEYKILQHVISKFSSYPYKKDDERCKPYAGGGY